MHGATLPAIHETGVAAPCAYTFHLANEPLLYLLHFTFLPDIPTLHYDHGHATLPLLLLKDGFFTDRGAHVRHVTLFPLSPATTGAPVWRDRIIGPSSNGVYFPLNFAHDVFVSRYC